MRGSLKQRAPGSWSLIFDVYKHDPETKGRIRKRKWVTFRGTKRQAERKLNDLIAKADRGELVEPSKVTLGEWLDTWMTKVIEGRKSPNTVVRYRGLIDTWIAPNLGHIRLQALASVDIEHYYHVALPASLKASTKGVHHALLSSALNAAVRSGLVTRNVASLVNGKPRARKGGDVLDHVLTADETAALLATAKAAGAQTAAFYALAVDSGARRGELAALQWSDLDTSAATLAIRRTLRACDVDEPDFGPTKTGATRTITLSDQTIALLKAHHREQAAVKMRNRQHYRDYGLIFAKDVDSPGAPLQVNTLGDREFHPLCKRAGIRRVKFHALRHTCATLMLQAGVPAHVVQQRLGHASIVMTLGTYSHALPTMQSDAAARLAALLYTGTE